MEKPFVGFSERPKLFRDRPLSCLTVQVPPSCSGIGIGGEWLIYSPLQSHFLSETQHPAFIPVRGSSNGDKGRNRSSSETVAEFIARLLVHPVYFDPYQKRHLFSGPCPSDISDYAPRIRPLVSRRFRSLFFARALKDT